MSEFQVTDEAIGAMWDRLRFQLYELTPTEAAAEALLEVARGHFLYMLRHFPEHVLTGVTTPAPGTGKHRLVVAIGGAFERDFAGAAKSAYLIGSH